MTNNCTTNLPRYSISRSLQPLPCSHALRLSLVTVGPAVPQQVRPAAKDSWSHGAQKSGSRVRTLCTTAALQLLLHTAVLMRALSWSSARAIVLWSLHEGCPALSAMQPVVLDVQWIRLVPCRLTRGKMGTPTTAHKYVIAEKHAAVNRLAGDVRYSSAAVCTIPAC